MMPLQGPFIQNIHVYFAVSSCTNCHRHILQSLKPLGRVLHPAFTASQKSTIIVSKGGSTRKSKEPKTRMEMVNTISDLQGSAYRLTSAIPSSRPVLGEASSICKVGHVKKP
uniref:Rhomboid-like protein n=1 Tax=Rhizophora mucronata TaxID=61149 RepID=A0A2P2MSK9_RHIMU